MQRQIVSSDSEPEMTQEYIDRQEMVLQEITNKQKITLSNLYTKIKDLKAKHENTKVFTYLVVHDLRHPTEAVIGSFE